MRRFINFLFIAGSIVGVFYLIGLIAPSNSGSSATGRVTAYPRQVSAVLADLGTWPSWHPTIQSVREREAHERQPVWAVTDSVFGSYDLTVTLAEDLRWAGSWRVADEQFNLRIEVRGYGADKSQVAVTVQRILTKPWGRAARLLWGKRLSPEAILEGLGRKLGSEVETD